METIIHPPTTVLALVAVLTPYGPKVEEGALVLAFEPPVDLEPVLQRLHTGVRADLTQRKWYGCDGRTGRVYHLNTSAPIPEGISLLSVEGVERWDRIDPTARLDHPELFTTKKPTTH